MMPNYSHVITTALYYANGDLHIGHLLEAIQADIYVKFLKQKGDKPLFVSGSDAHGTPIMIASKKLGVEPDEMVKMFQNQHKQTFEAYGIEFDNYHITHSKENQQLTSEIFKKIQSSKIFAKTIEQAFDKSEQMFLPDRYIKGTCPKCTAADQYGDSCEKCGAFYEPLEMIDPISTLSGTTPIKKQSEHIFFDLPSCQSDIKEFIKQAELQKPVYNKLGEWLNAELRAWDISRDAPYFGFEIPGYPNKYFYVWLDAPIGYIASCTNLNPENINLWQNDSNAKIIHFIGKDIMYFHGIFWPAVLKAAELKQPDRIFSHGFLTINGQKMSKSRGTMINASSILQHFEPDQIRFYLASKLSSSVEDIDLNFQDLVQKINSDIIGKYLNIASRTAGFINKQFAGILLGNQANSDLYLNVREHAKSAISYYTELEYAKACKEIMLIADLANQAVAEAEPWKMAKDPTQKQACHIFCSEIIMIFRDISILLQPIMPETIKKVADFLNCSLKLTDLHQSMADHNINSYPRIMERIHQEIADLYA